jgi:hypothetical protein
VAVWDEDEVSNDIDIMGAELWNGTFGGAKGLDSAHVEKRKAVGMDTYIHMHTHT